PGDLREAHALTEALLQATQVHTSLRAIALLATARVQLARMNFQDAVAAARALYELMQTTALEEWEESARLTYIDALEAAGMVEEAHRVLAEAFDAVRARARDIQRPEM